LLAFLEACGASGQRTDDAPVGRWIRNASADETNLGRIVAIEFDPKDAQVIYAGTREGFVIKLRYYSDHVTNDFLAMPRKYQLAVRPEIAMAEGPPGVQYLNALGSSRSGILYAAFAGIMKSSNRGEDWEQVYNMPTVLSVTVDPRNESTVFAGTESAGLLRTTDGGRSWKTVLNVPYTFLVVFDSDANVLAVGAEGLWKSSDSGNAWQKLNSEFVTSVSINPRNAAEIYAGTANSTPGEEVLRHSNDGGQTWSVVRKGFVQGSTRGIAAPALPIAVDYGTQSTLYVGTMGAGVFKSVDGGRTWHELNEGLLDLDVFSLAVDPRNSEILYAGTGSGKFWRIRQGQ